MMKCPECGCPMHDVVETRKRGDQIYRRRECYNKHRFSTLETVVDMSVQAPATRKRGGKYPQTLVNQCLADRDAGHSYKEIARRHGVPANTLAGWLSRGERAPQTKELEA